MNREIHVRICESVRVRFPCATRLTRVVGRESEWVNGGRDVRRSKPLTRSLSQTGSRAWGWQSLAAPAPEPVRRRGLPRLGAGLGVGHFHLRTPECSKSVQILTHSIFERAILALFKTEWVMRLSGHAR
jgi:hypothetical protein